MSNKALYWDIETHAVIPWKDRSPQLQEAFIKHYYDNATYDTPEEHYNEIAGLHAEFSQAICVVFGYENPTTGEFATMAIHGVDEVKVLNDCKVVFDQFEKLGYYLVDWNGGGCDRPYMIKRYILNKMKVPNILKDMDKKPWERIHVDAMDLWKFGSWSRHSLQVVSAAMNIPCKSGDLGGSNLYTYPIDEMPWDELIEYCKEDVVSMYKVHKNIIEYYG